MKKLLCLIVIGFAMLIGCAPADTGDPAPSDNETSQVATSQTFEAA